MMTKLFVLSGALLHASGGDTFCPVQFGFLAKLPAFFGCIIALSKLPGEVRRNAVGGPSCVVVEQAARESSETAASFFIVRGSFRRSCGRSSPSLRLYTRALSTRSVSARTACWGSRCRT